MVVNENASPESLWNLKLPDGSTEQDYKRFCEFIYNYIGLDIYDYLPRMFREFTKKEFSNFKKE